MTLSERGGKENRIEERITSELFRNDSEEMAEEKEKYYFLKYVFF